MLSILSSQCCLATTIVLFPAFEYECSIIHPAVHVVMFVSITCTCIIGHKSPAFILTSPEGFFTDHEENRSNTMSTLFIVFRELQQQLMLLQSVLHKQNTPTVLRLTYSDSM